MAAATADGLERDRALDRKKPDTVTDVMERPPLGPLLWDDVKRATAALLLGCGVAAVGDFIVTAVVAPSAPGPTTWLRLLLLSLSLFGILYLVLAPLTAAAAVAARLVLLTDSRARARRFRGLLAPARPYDRPRPGAAWLWGGAVGAALYLLLSSGLTLRFMILFKEQELSSMLLAGIQLALFGLCGALAFSVAMLARRLSRPLHPRLGQLNPVGHPVAAAVALLVLAVPVVSVVLHLVPQAAPLVPWRLLLAIGLVALGAHSATYLFARRGSLLPAALKPRLIAAGVLVFGAALLLPVTLVRVGADPLTKSLALSASPPMRSLIDLLRVATDFDHDGYGELLGENDCAPLDPKIHPLARDIPDDGIDQNCDGRDFQLGRVASYRTGQHMPVPAGFKQKWNVLLITVDATRYDHTTMGGYLKQTGRNTTPNLAKLAARSASFSFAQAAAPGTMASVPAIISSKYFHDGLALDEHVKHGMPPRLKKSNLLLAELFHAAGYTTGAILTHEYFDDWGMEQGFDTYDKSMGEKWNPYGVTSPELTDKALAWIGQRAGKDRPWFLWLHYLDPHGRYVAHPGERSYGTSEEDLYDGEIAFTDKYIGQLLDEMARMPGADRTVVVVTSDHGDGFKEHGFINHGMALYRELENVPLVIFVPNIEPRVIPGAVSGVDIVPTLVDLCGLDPKGAAFEGESLVPQLFYHRNDMNRVVFSETNWPQPLRAATTAHYKLIFNLKTNLYELYDLTSDPWEHHNVWLTDKAAFQKMKGYLDDWLERVYYSRDAVKNQVMMDTLSKYLLDGPPSPQVPLTGVSFDGGNIKVLGFDTDKPGYQPGDKVVVTVYFHALKRPVSDYEIEVQAWPGGRDATAGVPGQLARSPLELTGGGVLPTSRWRDGEYVRDQFKLRLPKSWGPQAGAGLGLGIRVVSKQTHQSVPIEGPARPLPATPAPKKGVKLSPAAARETAARARAAERDRAVILGQVPLAGSATGAAAPAPAAGQEGAAMVAVPGAIPVRPSGRAHSPRPQVRARVRARH